MRLKVFKLLSCKKALFLKFTMQQHYYENPAVVAWRYSSGLITEPCLSRWINPRLGHT